MARNELKFEVKLDKVHKVDLEVDLDIDKTELNKELAQQPSLYAWYAMLAEMARNRTLQLKNDIEVLESKLDREIRLRWHDSDGKMTEAGVSAKIKLSPLHQDLIDRYLKAQYTQGVLMVAKQALEQRKDMLISIAANMRGESDLELKVNKDKVRNLMHNVRKGES